MTAQWENIAFDRSSGPPVTMRVYESALRGKAPPLVFYMRGGSFLDDHLQDREQPVARALADSGAVVVETDYGRQSGNTFPQMLDCAFTTLQCLSQRRKQFGGSKSVLLVAGEEAGGNVAAGLALKARDRMPGELDGQILLSPMIDPLMTTNSIRTADTIGMRQRWSDGWSHYLRLACGLSHPYAAPCLCSRLTGVAPALVVTAEDDPLRDETLGYAGRLDAAGVSVRQHVFPAGSGWTGIYNDEGGLWLQTLCDQFTGFVGDLRQ